jgi:outer membrane protein TolC
LLGKTISEDVFPPSAFGDALEVDIDQAIDLAIENNNRIKIAESDVALAREARRQAHKTRGVTVSLNHRGFRWTRRCA